MKEIWKDIKNFEGKYQISNLGNVRSLYDQNQFKKTYRIRYLKLGQRQGYSIIQLTDGCKIKRSSYQIHRLVAEAFISNPENKPFINHIDENRKNNNVNNLEWCTQKENVNHSKHKMYGQKRNIIGKSGEKYITKRKRYGREYYEISVYYNGKRKHIGSSKTLEQAVQKRDAYIKLITKENVRNLILEQNLLK